MGGMSKDPQNNGWSQEELIQQNKEYEMAKKKLAEGSTVDKSGPIAQGVVESGQASQQAFDKMKGNNASLNQPSNEAMAMGIVKNLQNAQNKKAPTVETPFKKIEVDQPQDIMQAKREALMKMMRG